MENNSSSAPILQHKYYDRTAFFKPENLLREARRQKSLPEGEVPPVVLLDPDGDIVKWLRQQNNAEINPYWAGYHTNMYNFEWHGFQCGIIPCAVGASFAVLVTEQAFVSGCKLLVSITSAGNVSEPEYGAQPFRIIRDALRDEGTSYHYMPPSESVSLQPRLKKTLEQGITNTSDAPVGWARSWTTDAPYRETEPAVNDMQTKGIDCVEMEAAALYACAHVRRNPVVCLAHITNEMAQQAGDFEKGEGDGSPDALQAMHFVADTLWRHGEIEL